MKKAIAPVVMLLATLPALASARRVDYAGYRIGDSGVLDDQTRISGLPALVEESGRPEQTAVELAAEVVVGQRPVRWWAYSSASNVPASQTDPNPHTQYNDVVELAAGVYSLTWTYGTAGYSPAFAVVDYDYITYSLSYNANGGSGPLPPTETRIVYTNSVEIAAGGLSRTGYAWSGWTNSLSTTVWTGGETVSGGELGLNSVVDGSNVVLRAKWTPNVYTVRFLKNTWDDVVGDTPSMSLTYDVPANLTSNAFVRTGYRFSGWATEEGGDRVYRDGAQVVNLSAVNMDTVSLYAVWAAKTFSVKYHRNDGSGQTRTQGNQSFDTPVEIVSESPRVDSGYEFAGWATSPDGVVEYEAGSKYQIDPGDADVVHLYAVWSPVEYTVRFDANGGEGTMADAVVRYDEVYTVPGCGFSKAGVDFLGWATNVAAGVAFVGGEAVSNLAAKAGAVVTFYAVWTETRYVAFYGNGADNPDAMLGDAMTFEGLETKTLVPNRFERTGYSFSGWAVGEAAAAAREVAYTNCEDVVSADLWGATGETNVFWAVWLANGYAVAFDPGGGAVSPASKDVVYDEAYGDLPQPVRTGYGFGGWYDDASGGSRVTSASVVKTAGDHTLYARWTANSYVVSFDPHGGTVSPASNVVAYASAYGDLPTPERWGFKFVGWYDAASDGSPVTADTAVATPADHTLHARWAALRYVAFEGNGAESADAMAGDTMTFEGVETKALVASKFVKTGFTFAGWATNEAAAAALDVAYADRANVVSTNLWESPGGTNFLYAAWRTNAYTVVFKRNGGTLTRDDMEDQVFLYGQEQELSELNFVSDLEFRGWATSETGDVVFGDMATVSNLTAEADGVVVLYAVWDNGGLSKAMHCGNLAWKTLENGTDWQVAYGEGEGCDPSGSAVSNMVFWTSNEAYLKSKDLSFKPATSGGMLSFWYKTSSNDRWNYLTFNGEGIASSTTWRQYGPVYVDGVVGARISYRADQSYGEDAYTVWIDQVKWEPDGVESPEDFEAIELLPRNAIVNGEEAGNAFFAATGTRVDRGHAAPRVCCTAEAMPLEGIVFDGWRLTAGGESCATNGNPLFIDGRYACFTNESVSTCDVRAVFKWIEYRIRYDANGGHGTVAPDSSSYFYTNEVALAYASPSPGYSLAGWSTNATGRAAFMPGQVVTGADLGATADGVVTLYAEWTQNVYTVTFRYRDGSGALVGAAQSVLGTESALPPDPSEYDSWADHGFIGWDVDYSSVVGDMMVTAQYEQCEACTVRFEPGDGAVGSMGDMDCLVGVEQCLASNAFTKVGYVFDGWAVEPSGDVAYADGASARFNADATLYAVWSPIRYSIAFDANGGEWQTDPFEAECVYDEPVSLPTGIFARAGHVMAGWVCGGMNYACGAVVSNLAATVGAVVVMAARWSSVADLPVAVSGLVYDGSAKTGVVASAGCLLAGHVATGAGSYTATATLEEGRVWPDGTAGARTVAWSIAKATYDMGGVAFADRTFEADGTPKSLAVSGTLPAGVTVSYSGNGMTEPGTYRVTARFSGDAANYEPIPDKEATLTITRKSEPAPPDPGPDPVDPEPDPEGVPELHPSGIAALGAFTAEKAATYNGWLKDGDGRIVALLIVKTTAAKAGRATKSTISVTPVDGKKYTRKTTFFPGGNPTDEYGLVYGARGLLGTFGGYFAEAAVDVYKSKVAEVKSLAADIPAATHTFAVDTGNGTAVFSAVVANTGKTKVQGFLEDGARISVSATGALGEGHFAVPIVSPKAAARCGFVLWLPLDGGSPTLANFYDATWTASSSGGSYAMSDGEHIFDFDEPDFRDYLASVDGFDVAPVGAVFAVRLGKWDAGRTVGRLKAVDGVPTVTGTATPLNLGALKLSYTAKSGLVKGSFKLYYMDGRRLKYDTVTVTGVVVDGRLFGSGTIKKLGSFAVSAQ